MNSLGCWQGKHTAEFSALLSSVQSPPRKSIASSLGVPYSTFDNWLRGQVAFPPDRIPDLVKATGDDRFIRFILDPLGLDYYHKPNGRPSRFSVEQHELLVCILGGKRAEEIKKSFDDGKLSEKERVKILEQIDREIRALVDLKAQIQTEKIKAEAEG